ncbi:ankyrin repeat-containing domain protein, partial [Coprinopsis sp. MPI-PUGE-AT-0042]
YYHLPALLPLMDSQINERTKMGKTALSLAAVRNDVVMAGLLLNLDGIDVNLQDDDGNTALMVAALWGSTQVVKSLLLDPRIDIHKRNRGGETALHCAVHAAQIGYIEVAWRLFDAPGTDIDAPDCCGRTPRWLASRMG